MKNTSASLLHTAWTEEEKNQIDAAIQFVENFTGNNFILEANLYLYEQLNLDFIILTVLDDLPVANIKSVVFLQGGIISPNISYLLAGSPCESVYGKEQSYYPAGLPELYPKNKLIAEMQVISYMGFPLFDKNENGFGCLAFLHRNIIPKGGFVEALINVFLPRLEEDLYTACSTNQSLSDYIKSIDALVC